MKRINLTPITGFQATLYRILGFFFSQMIKLFSACFFFFYNYFLLLATDYVFVHVFHDSPQKERLFHLLQFKL